MPATIDIRLPVTPNERDALVERAGEDGIAAYLRSLLGLPPRHRGRPKKAADAPAKRRAKP